MLMQVHWDAGKSTAADEEANNDGSDWISATLPVRKHEVRSYQVTIFLLTIFTLVHQVGA